MRATSWLPPVQYAVVQATACWQGRPWVAVACGARRLASGSHAGGAGGDAVHPVRRASMTDCWHGARCSSARGLCLLASAVHGAPGHHWGKRGLRCWHQSNSTGTASSARLGRAMGFARFVRAVSVRRRFRRAETMTDGGRKLTFQPASRELRAGGRDARVTAFGIGARALRGRQLLLVVPRHPVGR